MSKRLLAAVFVVCGCIAQVVADGSVTLYGRASLSYDQLFGYPSTLPRQFITSDSTRIGFKGEDALGDGFYGIFQIETGVALDDASANAFASRDSFVGIRSPYGTLKIGGDLLNAPDDAHGIFGTANLTGIAASTVLWGNGYVSGPVAGPAAVQWDMRLKNSIRYDSPSFSGLTFALQGGKTAAETPGKLIWSGNVRYRQDGLDLFSAYEIHRQVRGDGLVDHARWLAAGYQINPLLYAGLLTEAIDYASPAGALKRNYTAGLVRYRFSPRQLIDFHAGIAGDMRGPAGQSIGTPGNRFYRKTGSQTGANVLETQYSFDVTKMTRLFVIAARLKNGDNATYNFQVPGDTAGAPGMRASVISVGSYITF
jgi:predicted porin